MGTARFAKLGIVAGVVGAVVAAFVILALTATDQVAGEAIAAPAAIPQQAVADDYTALERASVACGSVGTIGDDGHTLTIDTPGSDLASGDDAIEWVGCVFDYASTPDSVIAQMQSTRALDGMQSAEWDGFTAKWTYHPDAGLDVILTED